MKYYPIDLKLKSGIFGDCLDDLDYYLQNGRLEIALDNEKFKTHDGCCFNYALKNKNLVDCDGAFELIHAKGYEPIDRKAVEVNDIVTYHYLNNKKDFPFGSNCRHFARVSDIKINLRTGKTIIYIISKWGDFPIYEGPLDLLPEYYGNTVVFWRKCSVKKEKVRNLRRRSQNLRPLTEAVL